MVSGGVVSGGTRRSSSVSTSLCCWARYSRRFIGQDFSGRNGSAVSLPELRISISTRGSAASRCLRQVAAFQFAPYCFQLVERSLEGFRGLRVTLVFRHRLTLTLGSRAREH